MLLITGLLRIAAAGFAIFMVIFLWQAAQSYFLGISNNSFEMSGRMALVVIVICWMLIQLQ